MYEKDLINVSKEKLIEPCNVLLSEMYLREDSNNSHITKMLEEVSTVE